MKYFENDHFKMNFLPCYFTFYSFLGWLMETVYMSMLKGTFVERGFLYGPFCPIYGFGSLLIIFFLSPFKKNLLILFAGSILLTSLLEYLTGFLLKTGFNRTWWSYNQEAFNLNGYICLKISIFWGFASILLVRFLQPLLHYIFSHIPKGSEIIVSRLIIFYFVIDISISLNSIAFTNYEHKLLLGIKSRMTNQLSSGLSGLKIKISGIILRY